MNLLKGILYKNNFFYNLLDYLKNGSKRNLRFKILNDHIDKNSTLIDICGGAGWLKEHINENIKYTVADASSEFGKSCKKKDIDFIKINWKNFNVSKMKFDYSVMIISLYQFKNNLKKIIMNLKKISKKKVIIIEEVSPDNEMVTFKDLKKKIRGYLCETDFHKKNNDLFTFNEFKILMKKNNFKVNNKFIKNNLLIATFKKKSK